MRGELIDSRWHLPGLAPPLIDARCGRRPASSRPATGSRRGYFAAARADRLTFSLIRGQRLFDGQPTPWDAPVTRIEAGGGVYLQRNLTVARRRAAQLARRAAACANRTFVSGQLAYWF